MNEITSAVAGRPARNSLSIALAQLDSGIIDPAGSRAIQICDAADGMLAILQAMIDQWPDLAAGNGDLVEAASEWHCDAVALTAGLKSIENRAQAIVANVKTPHGTAVLEEPPLPRIYIKLDARGVREVVSDTTVVCCILDEVAEDVLEEGEADFVSIEGKNVIVTDDISRVDVDECDRIDAIINTQQLDELGRAGDPA